MSSVIKWFQDYITGTVAQASENIRLNNIITDGAMFGKSQITSLAVAGPAVLTAAQTGTTFNLTGALGPAVTLPAVASSAGVQYRFVNGPAALTATNAVITAPAGLLYGEVLGNATWVRKNAATTITFIAGTSVLGDTIDMWCDGTNWYVKGASNVSAWS